MSSAFPDVKPFPQSGPAQAGLGHNRAPLDEMVVAEFMEGLQAEPGLMKRIDDLVQRGEAAGPCESEEQAGRYGDFIKMVRAARMRVEEEYERHNRPLINARTALKGRQDSILDKLVGAAGKVQRLLDAFMNEQRRKADEARRQAEEQARAAREAAEREAAAAGLPEEAAPLVDVAPVRVEEPVVRGDYGSRVGSKTVWHHEILSVRQLPDSILKHEKVIAALNQVIGAQVRSGTRELKGVRIWSEQTTSVR